MILVSGTKRSGTSMWMQILRAAGLPVWGDAFPRDWGESIRAANPLGFFESSLRRGVYEKTNPDPRTGVYLAPDTTRRLVVKVFARGIVRTELGFMEHVIASLRPIAEYIASMERLYAMEHAHRRARAEAGKRVLGEASEVLHMAPALEWWQHNYMLLRDAETRGYPLCWVSYAAVLRDPERALTPVLAELAPCGVRAALDSVKPSLRTQRAESAAVLVGEFSASQCERFDELFARVDAGRPLSAPFKRALAEVNRELTPRVRAAREALKRHRQRTTAAGYASLRRSA